MHAHTDTDVDRDLTWSHLGGYWGGGIMSLGRRIYTSCMRSFAQMLQFVYTRITDMCVVICLYTDMYVMICFLVVDDVGEGGDVVCMRRVQQVRGQHVEVSAVCITYMSH